MLHQFSVRVFRLLAVLAGLWLPTQYCDGQENPPRPIQGVAAGTVTAVVPPNELVINYTGISTHLGNFTREEHLFLNPDGSFSGTMVVTAANGDQLWLDFSGAFTSPNTAEGTYTFTGGTGRFSNATGNATFAAYTPDGIHVLATFEGTIRY
jgi:hypothetical protein